MVKRVVGPSAHVERFARGPRAIQLPGGTYVEMARISTTGRLTNRTAAPFSGTFTLYVTSGGLDVAPKQGDVQSLTITNLAPFAFVDLNTSLSVTGADGIGPIRARAELKNAAGIVVATKAEQGIGAENKGTSELTLDISFGVG